MMVVDAKLCLLSVFPKQKNILGSNLLPVTVDTFGACFVEAQRITLSAALSTFTVSCDGITRPLLFFRARRW